MIDGEKVIIHLDDLRQLADVGVRQAVGPENWYIYATLRDYIDQITEEVEALLKEQESAEPDQTEHIVFGTNRKCSNCGKHLFPAGKFCPHCKSEVKWE